jgi:hypothetical protein
MKTTLISTLAIALVVLVIARFIAIPATFFDIWLIISGFCIGYIASYIHHYLYAKKLK